MTGGTTKGRRPSGVQRMLLRLPIWLYRFRLGRLLGDRFVMISHLGRKTGALRQTVVEVVDYNPATHAYIVASGWGEKADWLQNIQKTPRIVLDAGNQRYEAAAARLDEDAAAQALQSYAQRHPTAFRRLARIMIGRPLTGGEADCRLLARAVPLLALRPRT